MKLASSRQQSPTVNANDGHPSRLQRLAPLALAALAFIWVLRSPINAAGSDPRGSLVASLALLETGSLRLDDYVDDADLPSRNLVQHAALLEHEQRVDYSFPLGVPLAGVPAVWLASQFGWDMRRFEDEARLHKWLAALSVALAILLTSVIADLVLVGPQPSPPMLTAADPRVEHHPQERLGQDQPGRRAGFSSAVWLESLALTAVIVLGSGLTGTMGLAFWSNNLAALLNLLALILLLRWEALGSASNGRDAESRSSLECDPQALVADSGLPRELDFRRATLLGLILACSAISRPSSALLGALTLPYVARVHGLRSAFRTGLSMAALALLFLAYSFLEYGQWLPPYYQPSRLSGSSTFGTALLGNLVSPGRGILLFAPWTGLLLIGLMQANNRLLRRPLIWLVLAWAGLHLLAISRFPHWWDGHSFGNRLLVEAMPGIGLVALCVWKERSERPGAIIYRWLFIALGAFAIWVHGWQALYNINTVRWNGGDWGPILGNINIDQHPEYLWDWRHPQMLASEPALAERFREFQDRSIPLLEPGQVLLPESDARFFENWYEVEGEASSRWRWSEGRWEGPDDLDSPSIVFRLAEPTDGRVRATLWLEAGSFEAQPAELWLNGQALGGFIPQRHFDPLRQGFPVPPGLLTEHNRLEFRLPEAREAGGGDARVLGLAFRSLMLEIASR